MPATDPPEDLTGFPTTALSPGVALFQIMLARDPLTGQPRTPWFFSSVPSARPGRFDLPAPAGSCYLSDRRHGAWLEVFRTVGLVDRIDVEKRRLVTAARSGDSLEVADLRAARARRFGVTNDLIAGDAHPRPQSWAAALRRAGFAGLVSTTRHDPTTAARTVTLFGRAGPRIRTRGWHAVVSRLTDDVTLMLMLERAPFGAGVASRPYDVPLTEVSDEPARFG